MNLRADQKKNHITVEIDAENSFITQRVELNAWLCCNDTDTLIARLLRNANMTKNQMIRPSTP